MRLERARGREGGKGRRDLCATLENMNFTTVSVGSHREMPECSGL